MSEEKFTISDDEAFEPVKKKKVNIKIIIAIAMVLVIAILIIIFLPKIGKIINKVGNDYELNTASGNILINNGVAAIDEEYIYYLGSNEEVSKSNIYRVKVDTNNYETFYEGGYDIRYLNVSDNYVCFVEFGYQVLEDGNYGYDVNVHKINKNDKTDEVIVDNGISYNNICIYVVDNYLYYVAMEDENVYRINLETNESEMYLETKNGFITLSRGYIIYSYDNVGVYARKIDDDNEIKLSEYMIYAPQIYDDYVYYTDDDQLLHKIKISDGTNEIVDENIKMYQMIVANGNIFYLKIEDEESQDYKIIMCKYNLSNGESTEIKEMTQLGYIGFVGNYLYNMNVNGNDVTAVLTNCYDSTEIELQSWVYNLDGTTYQSADMENVIGTDI